MGRKTRCVVVDANIFINAALSTNSGSQKIFNRFLRNEYELFAPDFLIEELNKYIEYFINNKGIDISKQIELLLSEIVIISQESYMLEWRQIYERMQHIDEKDTDFVACAMYVDAFLRTNDRILKEKVYRVDIVNTDDLFRTLPL